MKQTSTVRVASNICGNNGLATKSGGAAAVLNQGKSVCSNTTPFSISFRSDAFEGVMGANAEGLANNPGFMLGYTMDATNCAATNG